MLNGEVDNDLKNEAITVNSCDKASIQLTNNFSIELRSFLFSNKICSKNETFLFD